MALFILPQSMSSLTVEPTAPLAAGAQVPSQLLSDQDVLDHQNVGPSDTPDRRGQAPAYERKLGDTEMSYYLQGRATGVNDMYLHLGFRSPRHLVLRPRVRAVWAILRIRHPLLASSVVMRDYDDVRFVFRAPASPEGALAEAETQLDYQQKSKDDLIDSYLNGPRTLSNERLSYLIVSQTPTTDGHLPSPPTPLDSVDTPADLADVDRVLDYELLICAAHFIGDGMALHQFANDFFGLLGGASSQEELDQLVSSEWKQCWGKTLTSDSTVLPASSEENFGIERDQFRRAIGLVDFQTNLDQQIGGQAFPRKKDPVRHTVVPTTSFKEDITKAMIKRCKANGVSISSAMFAICNIAWARMCPREKQELPVLMYSPINIRPYFPKPVNGSYWFLSVGYFNVVLPNFIPESCDVSKTFWLRARKAKEQSSRVANSPMFVSRTLEMATKRGKQARLWAKEDDEKEAGVWVPPPPTSDKAPPASQPSIALLGISLLGNLDGTYKHANFPDIKLHTLTTGSRQRHSAMLMFAYTFAGKLWISLGYDENGFERETVDLFWGNVEAVIHEFLVQ